MYSTCLFAKCFFELLTASQEDKPLGYSKQLHNPGPRRASICKSVTKAQVTRQATIKANVIQYGNEQPGL